MIWKMLQGDGPEALGFLPVMVSADDKRPVREQFDDNYAHGGGWRPMRGWTLEGMTLRYPGDPPLKPIATSELRGEKIFLYPYAWVAIVQKDGSFEVARLD